VLDACKDARLTGCRVSAGDDGIAIKSGYNEDGRRVGIESSDITIQNCTFIDSEGAGVAIGSETAGGIKNVTVSNCVFDNLRWAFRIKTNRGRGGVVQNVRLSQLVVHRPRDSGFDITGVHDRGLAVGPPESTPIFRDIVFSDSIISEARVAGSIHGLPESWFQNITLKDLHVNGTESGLSCQYVSGLVIDNVSLSPRSGPAVAISSARDVEVRQLRLTTATAAPAIELEGVREALIASCHTPSDTKRFLALRGGGNGGIVLMNNAIPGPATPSGPGLVLLR
jgi:hypothetical protein